MSNAALAPDAAPRNFDQCKAERLARLRETDPLFREGAPLPSVVEAKRRPGLCLAELVQITMEGYADRPALGCRARALERDPDSGRNRLVLLPRFETRTYRELWASACALASDWVHDEAAPVAAGDFICILGFTSPEYAALLLASIHVGGVNVPLQTSAPTTQHAAIIAETEPVILAVSVDYLEAAVDAVLAGTVPRRLLVFDLDLRDDDQRESLARARARLSEAGCAIRVDTLEESIERGRTKAPAMLFIPPAGEDPLAWLFYTSGSTGTPKGAMFPQSLAKGTWLHGAGIPAVTLSFMPMSHGVGNGYLLLALGNGGTSYCAPKSDLSTLFEDFALARPTMASLVPRVCELFHQHYRSEVERRVGAGDDRSEAEAEMRTVMREQVLGGRLLSVGCGSAALAPETYAFMETMLELHIPIGYSSTEIGGGTLLVDWKVQRPPVIDYRLADVPEAGYFSTDKPHPRGELLVKSSQFMRGYYKRPELTAEKLDADGYYHTGDVMAEVAPDQLVFVDRCNNVIKLSQGEFVAVSRLEALYAHHSALTQIYLHGSAERAFLLAVVVPSAEFRAGRAPDDALLKRELRAALKAVAESEQLASWELPRDFIVETAPFGLDNGLLSEIGKLQRPKLKARYGAQLEALYARLAEDQTELLRRLRRDGASLPVEAGVALALQATLGLAAADIRPESRFAELGGDSLSALNLSLLLEEIYGVSVPAGVITGPAGSVARLAATIETERNAAPRPSFARTHGTDARQVRASELALDRFIEPAFLREAANPKLAEGPARCVLLTGTTGFLGRFMAMAWLERLARCDGRLVCIVRGEDDDDARRRLEAALDTDPVLIDRFRTLAARHLEVIAGDLAEPRLGLDEQSWHRLAESVDRIVHPAAHVNHVLPYAQLFSANVAGTAELIRLALSTRRKPVDYVSTLGVNALGGGVVDESVDIREQVPRCEIGNGYANGYNISKWAGEVLLREAHERCGLPVAVFRPGMILAHARYVGQINVPDMFSRLLFSLAATGIAPATFYAEDGRLGRPRARYEGLGVDVLADAITAIGASHNQGFASFNLVSPHDDGTSLDSVVDWMIEAGCAIERLDRYSDWLARFEAAMKALPERLQQQSMLAILAPYRQPQPAGAGTRLPSVKFDAAARTAGSTIPPLTAELIAKTVDDLRALGWLSARR